MTVGWGAGALGCGPYSCGHGAPRALRRRRPASGPAAPHLLGTTGSQGEISHGWPNFYTKKVFAGFGAVVKGDHQADDLARSLVFLPDADERLSLLEDPRFFVPGYVGAYGWIAIDLRSGPDWTEVAELVDMSYRNTAPKKLVALLDPRR